MATTLPPPGKLPAENNQPLQYGAPGRPELAQYPPPKESDADAAAGPPLQYGAPDQPGLAQYPPPDSSFYAQQRAPPPPQYPPPEAPAYQGYDYSGCPYQEQYHYNDPYAAGYSQQPPQPPMPPQPPPATLPPQNHSAPPPLPSAPPPQPAAGTTNGPAKKVETEEERRKRKENERRKYEERKRAEQKKAAQQAAAKQGAKAHAGAKQGEGAKEQNRLKRPTNFVCRIKFRNELPEVLGEPKFLLTDLDPDRYTKYTITTLEKRYKHKLLLEPDLGIPLDLMDLSVYTAPPADQRPPMDPEDRALLQDDVKAKVASADVIKKKERPAEEGMKWLVRTSYISNIDSTEATKTMGLNEKQLKQRRDEQLGLLLEDEGKTDREKQIASIEATFEAAQQVPVHAEKPHLRPELVLPLLPDAVRFDDPFVQVVFDSEPTLESERHRHYAADVREEMASRAMMKGFTIQGHEGQAPEKFIAYMVPCLEEVGAESENRAVEFDWVREYHWQFQPSEAGRSTFVLNFADDQVSYLPLKNGLRLKKRKAPGSRQAYAFDEEDDGAFRQPRKVTVQRRSEEEIEEDIRLAKIARQEEEERLEAEQEERERREEEARAARAAERAARGDSDDDDEGNPKRGPEDSGEEEERGQQEDDED